MVALKCDLREDASVKEKLFRRGLRPVSYEEGLSVARSIRATRYLGKSAMSAASDDQNARQNTTEAFKRQYMRQPKQRLAGRQKEELVEKGYRSVSGIDVV
jgi:hypothetical protein